MKLIFVLLTLFPFTLYAEKSCEEVLKLGFEVLKDVKSDMKKGTDINEDFGLMNDLIFNRPECISYEKLNLTDNQVAQFRKFIHAPDRSFNLNKEKCTEFKVDTTFMPKNNDQGKLGWCFAYTTTDLLSFYEKKKFSAYDIALFYHNHLEGNNPEKKLDYSIEGGTITGALRIIQNNTKGLCLEDEVNYTNGDWNKLSDLIFNLTKKGTSLQQIVCENKFNEKDIFKDFSQDIFQALDKLSAEKRASAILDIMCKKRYFLQNKYKAVNLWIADTDHKVTKENVMEQLDRILAKGEPASIAYSADLLQKGVNFQGRANHGSTIIGRKFNEFSGQCEYLIKNSWGSSDCQKTSSIKCEKGNYWVPRTSLKNNIEEVIFIETDINH